jgi:hypothetical protein
VAVRRRVAMATPKQMMSELRKMAMRARGDDAETLMMAIEHIERLEGFAGKMAGILGQAKRDAASLPEPATWNTWEG